jgi:predicted metal-dependent hydrolase
VVAGILFGSLSLLVGAPAAQEPPPSLDDLWNEYPLEPQETETSPEPRDAGPSTTAPPTDDASTPWTAVALGGMGATVVLLAAGLVIARVRRAHELPAPTHPETPDELITHARALAIEAAECDMFCNGQRDERIRAMTQTDDRSAVPETSVPSVPSGYADIGERVAGVLTAAEAAAGQIRQDAHGEAEEILNAARREAEAVRQDSVAYDTDTRAAVESYASDRRREVDQETQKLRADSETQARATRQAAEAMARQIEEEGRQRGQALRDESKAVEERLKKAVVGLRRMTGEIEELLGTPAGDAETLTDALRPYSQRDELPIGISRDET